MLVVNGKLYSWITNGCREYLDMGNKWLWRVRVDGRILDQGEAPTREKCDGRIDAIFSNCHDH